MKMIVFPDKSSPWWPIGMMGLVFLLSVVLWTASVSAAMLPRERSGYGPIPAPVTQAKVTQEDMPDIQSHSARATWIGAGDLRKFTITNTGLLGLYEQPPDWSGYDGTWPTNITNWNGWCAEYPAGSGQYYNFSTGPWIGAMFPVILGNDTTWEARVATGAYDPDMTPLSPLWTSDQMFPSTDANAGSFRFAASGQDPLWYQDRWPYADSGSINPRRRATFGHNEYALDPENGDMVSLQDTWSVYGDYWPEDEANFLWPSFGYDTDGLGIRVEQHTYSWSYGVSSNYVFVNFKIWNMNRFDLENLYFGFFMDNDVGPGDLDAEGMGPNDDLIGYDESLKLGYTFDNDLREPGWPTSAGYIGCVFVETPTRPGEDEEIGLTAFSTWVRGDQGPEGVVDYEQNDDLKYAELVGDPDGSGFAFVDDPDPAVFEVFEEPRDVRQLSCSGPYYTLPASVELIDGQLKWFPERYVSWTLAIVMGRSLAELKANTIKAQEQFNMGYLGDSPPPSPVLTATPGDKMAFLTWDDSPEDVVDLITGEMDFEGYRVYRSTSGLAGSWEQLAEYDIAGDSTGRAVQVRYARGNSVVDLGFDHFLQQASHTYVEGEYLIEFASDTSFTVYSNTQQTLYKYNQHTRDSTMVSLPPVKFFTSFCVVDPEDTTLVYPPVVSGNEYLGRYVSGALIYMNGFYFRIADGEFSEQHPPGTIYHPQGGDLFTVRTFLNEGIGDQTGLFYSYTDEGLTNGVPYYYSVTCFDKGSREEGLESLESAKSGRKYAVVPRTYAADVDDRILWSTENNKVVHSVGAATGSLFVEVAQPMDLTGDSYTITFFKANEADPWADYWRLTNASSDTVLLDSMTTLHGEATPEIVEGLRYTVQGPERASLDTLTGGFAGEWTRGSPGYDFGTFGGLTLVNPSDAYDFEMTFPEGGTIDRLGISVPWMVTNISLDVEYVTWWADLNKDEVWNQGDQIKVYNPTSNKNIFTLVTMVDNPDLIPSTGDVYLIVTNKPFTDTDQYSFVTTRQRSDYSLDNVTVVPNPYYIRAPWDSNRFNQWLYFQHLPSHCTIRIFTAAGLLIRTLRHDSPMGNEGQSLGDGSATWDLLTEENMRAVSGLYIYQIEADDGKTVVGKFAVIR